MILIDFSSLIMSSIMVQIKDINGNPDLIRHMVFNMIRRYNLEHREEFGETVVCFDSKNNWRKETFPEYKANRKKNREESDIDWNMIFDIIGQVKDELREYSPFRCLEVERCEADDIIGTICEKQMNPEPILIISPDRDFVQLQRYPNVRQFSNVQKKWVEPKEGTALDDLSLKILTGDSGDGVPNVLSDDTTLTEGRRQGVLSKKKKLLWNSSNNQLKVLLCVL
jgi:5'-3' exonuclease